MTASDFQLPLPGLPDEIAGAICLVFLVISWVCFFGVFNKVKAIKPESTGLLPPLSLVIAARNELQNLQNHIPVWLNQDYPHFELVIADDGSTDGTAEYVTKLCETEPRLRFVLLDPQYVKMHGKKIALTLAFKKAAHKHFILTDADCIPASDQWLKQMAAGFANGHEIVIGYSPYQKQPGMLNQIIRYETLVTALHYLGFAMKHKPYMGVGRNLAYTRNLYDQQGGFARHSHIPAGDDDLFVQQAANAQNTAVCLTDESMTISIPKTNLADWRRQKKRHFWVGKFYEPQIKRRLAWYPLSQTGFALAIGTWFFVSTWFVYPLAFLFIRWIPEWVIFSKKSRLLKSPDLGWSYPLFSTMYSFWYPVAGLRAFFSKKPTW